MTRFERELSAGEARDRAARGAMSVLVRHAAVRLLAFAGTLVLARLIAPAEFGLFVAAQFVLSVLQALAVGGVTSALIRRRDVVEPADYRVALTLQQGLAAIVVVAVWVAAPRLAAGWERSADLVPIVETMALALFPLSLRAIPFALLQRALRHDLTTMCEVGEYVVHLAVAIGLALLGWGVWALVAATLARHLAGALLAQVLVGALPRFGFDRGRAARLLGFAVALQGQMLIDLSQRSVVPVVVGALFGAAAVGVTGMANTMLEALVLQPLAMLAGVQLRLFARIQDDRAAMARLLEHCLAAGLMVFLPPVVLLGVAAPTLMPHVLSPAWAGVGELIRWLTPVSALQIVTLPTSQAAKAMGLRRAPLIGGLANLAIQIGVVTLLAPRLGLVAYPVAAGAGVGANYLMMAVTVHRRIGGRPLRTMLPILAGLAVATAVWAGAVVATPSPTLLVGAFLVGLLVHAGVVVAFAGRHLAALLRFAADALPARLAGPLRRLAGWSERRALG